MHAQMGLISMNLRAIDLFCGCGGMTQGLRDAGFSVLAGIDLDENAIKSYSLNHKMVKVFTGDIRGLSCRDILNELGLKRGELELLVGCPPCQGFSRLRTKNGRAAIKDKRNDLIFEFVRFVKSLKPKSVMLENVPGLASDRRFYRFIKQMEILGYVGGWKILNAENFGVPQRRKRLIYLAGFGSEIKIINDNGARSCVRDAIWSLRKAGSSGDYLHDIPESRSDKVMKIIKAIPKDGGSRCQLPKKLILDCHKRYTGGFRDVYGRMAWDGPAPTITGGCTSPSKGRFLHPCENRAITLREAALLQGFPSNYRLFDGVSKDELSLMIGNALPPPFISAHARIIKRSLRKIRRVYD